MNELNRPYAIVYLIKKFNELEVFKLDKFTTEKGLGFNKDLAKRLANNYLAEFFSEINLDKDWRSDIDNLIIAQTNNKFLNIEDGLKNTNRESDFIYIIEDLLSDAVIDTIKKLNSNEIFPEKQDDLIWGENRVTFRKKLDFFINNRTSKEKQEIYNFIAKELPEIEKNSLIAINGYYKRRNSIRRIGLNKKGWVFLFDQLAVSLHKKGYENNDFNWMTFFLKDLVELRQSKDNEWNLEDYLSKKLQNLWGEHFENETFDLKLKEPYYKIKSFVENGFKLTTYMGSFLSTERNLRHYVKSSKAFEETANHSTLLGGSLTDGLSEYFESNKMPNQEKSEKGKNIEESKNIENLIPDTKIFINKSTLEYLGTHHSISDNLENVLEDDLDFENILKILNGAFYELRPIERLILISGYGKYENRNLEYKSKSEKLDRPYLEIIGRYDKNFDFFADSFSKLYDKTNAEMENFSIRIVTEEKVLKDKMNLDKEALHKWFIDDIRGTRRKRFYDKLDEMMPDDSAFKQNKNKTKENTI